MNQRFFKLNAATHLNLAALNGSGKRTISCRPSIYIYMALTKTPFHNAHNLASIFTVAATISQDFKKAHSKMALDLDIDFADPVWLCLFGLLLSIFSSPLIYICAMIYYERRSRVVICRRVDYVIDRPSHYGTVEYRPWQPTNPSESESSEVSESEGCETPCSTYRAYQYTGGYITDDEDEERGLAEAVVGRCGG